ncbi:MAG: GYF domain-containing protein [Akkermansiaceae bacterium]
MSDQEWRVLDGEGNEQGPYSFQDLQSYYTSGNITHETMIWTEGLEAWVPAGQVEGLLPEVPQAIPLAPAPTVAAAAPMAQPVAAGGINLSPQISGVTAEAAPGAPPAQAPAKTGAPTWLSIVTIASGVIALILYFFPWVSVSQDMNFFKAEKNIIKLATQTGIQSITQTETVTDEAISEQAKQFGVSEDEIRKNIEGDGEKENDEEEENYKSSTLNLIALIAIGTGVFLALIGLLNKAKVLTMMAQILFAASAILIGVQMAQKFPMIKAYIELQEKMQKSIDESVEAQEELTNAVTSLTDKAAEAVGEMEDKEAQAKAEADLEKQKTQMQNEMAKAKAKASNRYATAFEPSCFITVGILGISILLVVVTMSTGDGTTLIVANPGLQPQPLPGQPQQPAQPQQPHQPGSGLKFH